MWRKLTIWAGLLVATTCARAADQLWQPLDHIPAAKQQLRPWIRPPKARPFLLRRPALQATLARPHPAEIALPMPDGTLARFTFVESPVMAPELAAKFPQIKTYLGHGIDDPSASVRFDWTPAGFHAQILSPRGAVYVDPYSRDDTELYTSYYKRDYRREADGFVCLTPTADVGAAAEPLAAGEVLRSGPTLRTYRLACAATGEYTQFHGGTVAAGLAAIVTAVNRVTGIYETEVGIRLVLVANNDQIVYTNPNTDPYTNNNGSTMLGQNQANLDAVIGSANYDIGHVFSTGGGGVAYLRCVCNSSNKAGGVTGLSNPIGDAFYVDYVAHEMGHQFGANHTFNSVTSSCGGGNRNGATAYEPGSGSTIMAYAGICSTDNLQSHSDPYFVHISFDEILAYTTGGTGNGCAVQTATGNTAPSVNAGLNYTIPRHTPFTLIATGSDPDGETVTYCWEERDLGPAQALTDPDNGSSPLFRSFDPTTDPSRTFPKLAAILNNTTSLGEKLPTTSRTLNFRVTARDNQAGGGGVNTADLQVTVASTTGPFVVTAPNAAGTLSGLQTVTWNVAGTAGAPVNAATVNILLSTDGGNTFPTILAAATPNDGSESVVLPNVTATAARVKIEAAGNIFFDISDANFAIVPAVPTPLVVGDDTTLTAENCGPGNAAIDPAESVTVSFFLKNVGTADTTNLVATLLATGGVTAPSAPQTYGALAAGGSAVSQPFTFTAAGPPVGGCGGNVVAVLQLQDGATDLGTVTNIFDLGSVTSTVSSNANTAAIKIPDTGVSGPADFYPSTINVSGVAGPISKVAVTLVGLSHAFPDDLDILLVAPNGQSVLLMSDAGGSSDLDNVTITFDDAALGTLPDAALIAAGTYQPTNYGSDDPFDAPAPAGPYASTLSALNGLAPNGQWSLYITDDAAPDKGSLAGGWKLTITASTAACCTASNNPPVITAAAISPSAPTEHEDLVANVTSASDPDGDPITYAYQWQESSDNVVFTSIAFTTGTLPASATAPETYYRVVITPHDGFENGAPFTTTAAFAAADTDQDGVPDASDNCPAVANPGQTDSDNDGLGDVCDSCPNDPLNDGDGDSICGDVDNCPSTANADQQDLDTDSLGDACDPDIDGDGLPNDWETAHGLNPNNPVDATQDPDGDGMTNEQEFAAGTDPQDAGDVLRITGIEPIAGDVQIQFPSVAGRQYRLEWQTPFRAGSWIVLTNGLAGTGGVLTIIDPGAAALSNRFYRVVLE